MIFFLWNLRDMNVDWGSLTMIFQIGESQITLKGDPTLTKAETSFKTLTRVWNEDDQGFLVELRSLAHDSQGCLKGKRAHIS